MRKLTGETDQFENKKLETKGIGNIESRHNRDNFS